MNIVRAAAMFLFGMALIAGCESANADEGGISFWLPGEYASLAAVPASPGLSFVSIYYHDSANAGAGQEFPRGGRIDLGVDGHGDLILFGPSWGFAQKLFGGQPTISLLSAFGHTVGSVSGQLTGPGGNIITAHRTDAVTGFSDLFPQTTLAWNRGVNNFMTYVTGDIPVGAYDKNRLANLSIGHGAIDAGGAYTYLNTMSGLEFSATTGFTYNFINSDTDYQNGVDWHLDAALSQFLSKQLHVGIVGYIFQQVSGDSGSGAKLGAFKSRVAGLGPEIGYMVPVGSLMGYLNLRGYGEFAAQNRASGWNLWLTLAISPGA